MYPVHLPGQGLTLREFRADDVEDLYAINSDERVTRWMSYDQRTREQCATAIAGIIDRAGQDPRTEYYLAAALSEDDRVIGAFRLGLGGVQAAKLGYLLNHDFWGQGYATTGARMMINLGFADLGLHRISAAIGPDNAASAAVVKRLGFHHEGRLRDHVFTNGTWRDSRLYSLLTHEWSA